MGKTYKPCDCTHTHTHTTYLIESVNVLMREE